MEDRGRGNFQGCLCDIKKVVLAHLCFRPIRVLIRGQLNPMRMQDGLHESQVLQGPRPAHQPDAQAAHELPKAHIITARQIAQPADEDGT